LFWASIEVLVGVGVLVRPAVLAGVVVDVGVLVTVTVAVRVGVEVGLLVAVAVLVGVDVEVGVLVIELLVATANLTRLISAWIAQDPPW
jgi:hypothetical protein